MCRSLSDQVQGHRREPAVCPGQRRGPRRVAGALACLLLVALPAGDAAAHHILGIPHYKYGSDYPQIPYVEILAQTGPTNLHFTYFPGTPEPGERIRFKLYAYDRDTKEPFREPLEVDVVRVRWLLSDPVVAGPTQITTGTGPEANDYKFFFTFDEATSYKVRVRFPTDDGVETIAFPVTIGETDTRPLFGGAVGALLLSIGSVAFLKRRRKKTSSKRGGRSRRGRATNTAPRKDAS